MLSYSSPFITQANSRLLVLASNNEHPDVRATVGSIDRIPFTIELSTKHVQYQPPLPRP